MDQANMEGEAMEASDTQLALMPEVNIDDIVDIAETSAAEATNIEDVEGPFLIFDADFKYSSKFQNSKGDGPAEVTLIRYLNDPYSRFLRSAYSVSEKVNEAVRLLVEQNLCTPEHPVLCKFATAETSSGYHVKKLVAVSPKEKQEFYKALKS